MKFDLLNIIEKYRESGGRLEGNCLLCKMLENEVEVEIEVCFMKLN